MSTTLEADIENSQTARSYCTFRIDGLLFGVQVHKVQEVLKNQPTTAVPLAPETVHGLMNLRGQIISALNVRCRLGLPSTDPDQSMNVVLRSDDGPISLLVDEIGDVIRVEESQFEPVPDTVQGTQRELTLGAYKLDNQLLLILDTDQIVTAEDE